MIPNFYSNSLTFILKKLIFIMSSDSLHKEINLSNIERKILKNTFYHNTNDLHLKEESMSNRSQFSISGKFQPSISRPSMEISRAISQDSFRTIEQLFSIGLQDIDLSRLSFQDENDVALRLQEVIRKAAPGALITLPAQNISLNGLLITSPITIKGTPGCSLEIVNGSIVVDFSSHSKESMISSLPETALMCELSIIFNLNGKIDPSGTSPPALFIMDSPNTSLEVRDCEIKSINHLEKPIVSAVEDSSEELQDICFWANGISFKRHATRIDLRYNSSLIIKSCNISNFHEVIKGGINSSIHIEKTHINNCFGNGVSILNPVVFELYESVIQNCQKNSVEIRVIPNSSFGKTGSRSPSLTSSREIQSRNIRIEGNDIKNSGAYGISIWSEQVSHFPSIVNIEKNKIEQSSKEGLAIRHLALQDLFISSNDFSWSQGSGLWLQKVYKLSQESQITVMLNRCFDSCGGYGIYLYEAGGIFDNNEMFRNSLGGIMVVGSSNKEAEIETNLEIKKCKIFGNGENGVTVLDFYQGGIEIDQCKISENYHNGVYLMQSRDQISHVKGKDQIAPENLRGTVVLSNNDISMNKGYGVTIAKFKVLIKKTIIGDNTQGAMLIGEGSKELVTFLDNPEEIKHNINGNVEGPKQVIMQEGGRVCGKGSLKCEIF
ncbi:unnamed protein product [Blepharisma stoltei]|uniref:Right handed beta helix domain-containing protein n=1 Tax=Blepharisma stoltei TaxID=1481888 RepID=A0AAU9IIN6_9CILI|nr:unnamed protein product [Blepharisma stoltei]